MLLLLQLLHHRNGNLERLRNDIGRSQCQPLREGNIRHSVRLIDLNPDQVFRLGRVFDVMPGVVWESGGVAGPEIEGPGICSAFWMLSVVRMRGSRKIESIDGLPIKTVALPVPLWK